MILVSFALVVVAAIALVIGLLQSGLTIIYVSIGCSLVAAILLVVAVMRGRPDARPATAPVARPAQASAPPPPPPPAPSAADQTVVSAAPPPPPPPPPPSREPVAARSGGVLVSDRTETLDQAEIEEAVATDDADAFPIHGYEKLRATEVLPMLAELDEEQLLAVRAREQAGKNRFMILTRIEDELQARQGEGWDADDEGWSGAPAEDAEDELAAPAPVTGGPAAGAGDGFPIPDYDELRALEVLGRLSDLNVSELVVVRRREEAGSRRAMVLNRIDRLMEEAPSGPEPEPLVVPPGRGRRSRAAAPRAKKVAKAVKVPRPAVPTAKTTKKAAGARTAAKLPATKARAVKAPAKAVKAPASRKVGKVGKVSKVAKTPTAKKATVAAKRASKRR